MEMRRWKLKESAPEEAYEALPSFPRVLAAMLWRRGIRNEEEAGRFLKPDWERDVHDPFLFDDMEKAVARVMRAKAEGERITIHGDYDADGISGSVILAGALDGIGAEYDVFLPHRERDGYGMNASTVEKLAEAGTKLIITTDCGISNAVEIARANELGVDVIVTDHHEVPNRLPEAYAILHPLREGETYPFRWLTGGGVAFKFAQALWKEAGLSEGHDKWLLDMTAISTIADIGRLVDENRVLVKYGLLVLNKSRRLGLNRLIETTRSRAGELDAESIGFQIAPRINAAGRMDHAMEAYNLLVTEDGEEAGRLADRLESLNLERRAETERMMRAASPMAKGQSSHNGIVLIGDDDWTGAICGLVASRVVGRYHRPTIVLTKNERGEYVGSGRSIGGFHITDALRKLKKHLVKFGGHGAACGMTIEAGRVEAFAEAFRTLLDEELDEADLIPRVDIEEELALAEANRETVELIGRLAPFGECNPKPLFLLKNVKVSMAESVGKDGAHLRMLVEDGEGHRLQLIAFRAGSRLEEAASGAMLDIVIELSMNEWNGRRSPQGRVVDFQSSLVHVPAGA